MVEAMVDGVMSDVLVRFAELTFASWLLII